MKNAIAAGQMTLWSSPTPIAVKAEPDWRIKLRPGMVAADHPQIKVFSSVTAFQGYVHELRTRDVVVSFATPFVAACQEAS